MVSFTIRPGIPGDRPWVTALLKKWWAGPKVVSRSRLHRADELPGFIAEKDGKPVGLVTYCIQANECEIVTFNSIEENVGIGTTLFTAVADKARAEGCTRLWLITTNDNIAALRFYQKRGMELAEVHRNALEESRKLKPEIPLVGNDGIPLRDEIEMEIMLE